jgi:hypothetical protein
MAMAEWRRVNHRLLLDSRVRRLGIKAAYCYVATILLADDYGQLPWDAEQLAEWIGAPIPDVERWLKRIADYGLVQVVERGGQLQGTHPKWLRYQREPQMGVVAGRGHDDGWRPTWRAPRAKGGTPEVSRARDSDKEPTIRAGASRVRHTDTYPPISPTEVVPPPGVDPEWDAGIKHAVEAVAETARRMSKGSEGEGP